MRRMREKNLSEIQVVNIRNIHRKKINAGIDTILNKLDRLPERNAVTGEERRKSETRSYSKHVRFSQGSIAVQRTTERRQQEKGEKERCFFLYGHRRRKGGGGRRGKWRERVSARRRGESPWGRNSRYSKARGGFTLHKFYRWREAVR